MTLPHWTELKSYINVTNPDGDTEEWAQAAAHRLLSPWVKDRVKFAFNDPAEFRKTGTVKPSSFAKVLKQLGPNGTLPEHQLIKLIETFASKCSKEDWKDFYQPVLQRHKVNYPEEMTIGWFNNICDDEFHIELFPQQPREIAYPTEAGFYYPMPTGFRTDFHLVVWESHIEMLDSRCQGRIDPSGYGHYMPYEIQHQNDLNYPLILEGHNDPQGFDMILTDAFELKHVHDWPGALRRQVLEDIYMRFLVDIDKFVLGEGYPAGADADLDEIGQHLFSVERKSLTQALFKPSTGLYSDPALIVPLHRVTSLDPQE